MEGASSDPLRADWRLLTEEELTVNQRTYRGDI
jgi:hypothetical protein